MKLNYFLHNYMVKTVENKIEAFKYFEINKVVIIDKRQNNLLIDYNNPYYFFSIKNDTTFMDFSSNDIIIDKLVLSFKQNKNIFYVCFEFYIKDLLVFNFLIDLKYVYNLTLVIYDGKTNITIQDNLTNMNEIFTTIGYLLTN